MTDMIEPNAFGSIGEEEDELCLGASENSLQAIGAMIGGCEESEASEPDAETGPGEESEETDFDDAPYGSTFGGGEGENEGIDCTGGGTASLTSGDTYTVDIAVEKNSARTTSIMEGLARDAAVKEWRLAKQKALLAIAGKECVEQNCSHCVGASSWSARPKGKWTVIATQKYNVGSSSEHWVITIKLEVTVDVNINVACICDD